MLILLCAVLAAGGTVTGKVTDPKGAPRAKVVVFIEGAPAPSPKVPAPTIKQKDLAFEPDLTVVPKGTTIEFPNEDKVFHNVFSLSEAARFDLGLYKSGSSKTVTFNKPGTIDIFCNIHPQMIAKVKVVDGPYFATTADDGTFRIEGVPEGTWTLVVWQPYGAESRQSVTIAAGAAREVAVQLEEGSRPRWHLKKDGTTYGRYK